MPNETLAEKKQTRRPHDFAENATCYRRGSVTDGHDRHRADARDGSAQGLYDGLPTNLNHQDPGVEEGQQEGEDDRQGNEIEPDPRA